MSTANLATSRAFFDQLNQDYLRVHKTKEDLFWDTYMAISDDHDGFAKAEQAYKDFIADPKHLAEVRGHLAALSSVAESAEKVQLAHGLNGWLHFFECNIIDDAAGRQHMADLVEMESDLFGKRRDYVMHHVNEAGETEEASLGMLSTNMGTNPNEAARKSSHDAYLGLEKWVLGNGFLDIVAKRNALAKSLGFADYFDYKVQKNEAMSSDALFVILDEFEQRTRQVNLDALAALGKKHGEGALLAHNLRFHMSGDVTRQMDPYLPFAKGLQRWLESFGRLGIKYRGALMQLDLMERKGKYQNGFCHGPIPTFYDREGKWVAGQINFTAEAKPDQIGSGARAINTLFHEGGHAAHFANVTQNAPCFSQEFAPTSMAYAETQSMFCDSLLDDADWLKMYARNAAGEAIPDDLLRARIELTQPFRAYAERSILVVPYFERELYRLSDSERTPDAVLALARKWEKQILGVNVSPRPLLAIPHLLNQESAASYHGYLLANMAVYQTRAYFLRTDGYLADNPRIGPALAEHYWAQGNGWTHNQTLLSLTGEGFAPAYLADECNQSVDDAWQDAVRCMAAAKARESTRPQVQPLQAQIRVIHGAELIADNSGSDAVMCSNFEQWVAKRFPASLTMTH